MTDTILSVGIDIGTSTTQLVFSRITIQNTASAFSVPRIQITDKRVVYESPVHMTPLLSDTVIDENAVRALVEGEYLAADVRPGDVATGAVIITGETARKQNATGVLEALSHLAGDFVVATAGSELEGIIAGRGAGTAARSLREHRVLANLDVGGGTTNIAVFVEGEAVNTCCLDIGGRLIRLDEGRHIVYIAPKLAALCAAHGVEIRVGALLERSTAERVCALMARVVLAAVGLTPAGQAGSIPMMQAGSVPTMPSGFASPASAHSLSDNNKISPSHSGQAFSSQFPSTGNPSPQASSQASTQASSPSLPNAPAVSAHAAGGASPSIASDLAQMLTDHILTTRVPIEGFTFSGGVGDCYYDERGSDFLYGDIGVILARALRAAFQPYAARVLRPEETLRATVIGAGMYTTELSGSTITYSAELLPIQNVPIVKLLPEEEALPLPEFVEIAQKRLGWYDAESPVALYVHGQHDIRFDAVQGYADKLFAALAPLRARGLPLVVLVKHDMAKVLGQALRARAPGLPLICLDSVNVAQGDYIDIGAPLLNGRVLPVIVKTLVIR